MKKFRVLLLSVILSVLMALRALASTEIGLNLDWRYAANSRINTGKAVLYTTDASHKKGITIAVNAGHGTKGGESVQTLCHPDGSKKLSGGTTAAGSVTSFAVSSGMTFSDGTPEHVVTRQLAHAFMKQLLAEGYDVLMLRDEEDVQLDNVARTVIANNRANCHIALHWDSTSQNKGAFYMSTPDGLKGMEPVASIWKKHENLGESLLYGLRKSGVKIYSSGSMPMDLTQTAYSTIPSVDIELGDRISDHSDACIQTLAKALTDGVNKYYGFS